MMRQFKVQISLKDGSCLHAARAGDYTKPEASEVWEPKVGTDPSSFTSKEIGELLDGLPHGTVNIILTPLGVS